MANLKNISNKKKTLLAYKEKLLASIKQLDISIEDFQRNRNHNNNVMFDDDSSSDSDVSFHVDIEPPLRELKNKHSFMNRCLQATQELTKLEVLQSEVNLLAETPVFEGEKPVECEGMWREVIADCKIENIPFLTSFYVHKPNEKFLASSYRGLCVTLNKELHRNELSNSILINLNTPSDVTEVIRNYSAANRSRKTSLEHLGKRYGGNIFMSPLAEGGYTVKYKDFFSMSWMLKNKWSPVAPFTHSFKFEIGYMDEIYVKRLQIVHKKLSNPTLETNERTQLIATMIDICIEAKGVDESEGLESDQEPAENTEHPQREERTDKEVMAPPKSLPKKVKPKGKENEVVNKNKRPNPDNDDENVKKMRLSNNNENDKRNADESVPDQNKKGNTDKGQVIRGENNKSSAPKKVSEKNSAKSVEKGKKINTNKKEVLPADKINEVASNKALGKNVLTAKPTTNKNNDPNKESNKNSTKTNKDDKTKNSKANDNPLKTKSAEKVFKSKIVDGTTEKNKNVAGKNKNVAATAGTVGLEKKSDRRPTASKENLDKKQSNLAAKETDAISNKQNPKIVANSKLAAIEKEANKVASTEKNIVQPPKTNKTTLHHHKINKNKIPMKSNAPPIINKQITGNIKAVSKANKNGFLKSKIPQKKPTSSLGNKQNAIRFSPRQITSKLKTNQLNNKKMVQRPNNT